MVLRGLGQPLAEQALMELRELQEVVQLLVLLTLGEQVVILAVFLPRMWVEVR
jgi:hypothetical protein